MVTSKVSQRWVQPPQWVQTIGRAVAKLVERPSTRQRFGDELLNWEREQRKCVGWKGHCGVRALPPRLLRQTEQFAILAAIHDETCEGIPLDQWPGPKNDRERRKYSKGDIAAVKAGIPYAVLRSRVHELTKGNRTQLMEVLDDVRKLFADRGQVRAAVAGPGGTEAGDSPYHSAEWFASHHGIKAPRLSEKAHDGKVRTKTTSKGYTDVEGRRAHILYHVGDALKYCSPQWVTKKARKKPLSGRPTKS
jgi:hypothetical protein